MDAIISCCRAVSPAVSRQIPGDREYSEIAKLPLESLDRSPVPSPNQSFAHKFPYFIDQGNWLHRAGKYFDRTEKGIDDSRSLPGALCRRPGGLTPGGTLRPAHLGARFLPGRHLRDANGRRTLGSSRDLP